MIKAAILANVFGKNIINQMIAAIFTTLASLQTRRVKKSDTGLGGKRF